MGKSVTRWETGSISFGYCRSLVRIQLPRPHNNQAFLEFLDLSIFPDSCIGKTMGRSQKFIFTAGARGTFMVDVIAGIPLNRRLLKSSVQLTSGHCARSDFQRVETTIE